jgi:alpha-tubulin suppressor-like RCC1 family protein
VTVGSSHSCALTAAGDAICWGAGGQGQRGDSSSASIQHDPTFVKTDRHFSAVVAGLDRTCAIESGTRGAWCWGNNDNGSLGTGVFGADRTAPAEVLGGLSFSRLSVTQFSGANAMPICGTTGDGIYCWGQVPQPLTFEE